MKIISKSKNTFLTLCMTACAVVSGAAMADETTASGTDLSTLTNSVNFSGVLTAIMAIAASLITLYAGYVGVRWVLRMVKGA